MDLYILQVKEVFNEDFNSGTVTMQRWNNRKAFLTRKEAMLAGTHPFMGVPEMDWRVTVVSCGGELFDKLKKDQHQNMGLNQAPLIDGLKQAARAGYSYAELAAKSGVSAATIGRTASQKTTATLGTWISLHKAFPDMIPAPKL